MRDRVRHLSKGVAIYGAGDAAVHLVNFLMLPVYVKGGFLRQEDYGAVGILLSLEAIAKVISRWGLDGAFMRLYHDHATAGTLARLASTLVWFIVTVDVALIGAAFAVSGWLGARLFDGSAYLPALRLMLLNVLLLSVTFVPFHLMRIRNEAVTYSALVFARSVGTLILRIVFVIGLDWGVTGLYFSDVVMTLVLLPVLWRWFQPVVGAMFSTSDLRSALRFGLPRVPHGVAQQALEAGNKLLLTKYIPLHELGVYQNGVALGTGVRFFTSAFETAWAPFYYDTARQPDAHTVFRRMTTYGVGVLTLLAAVTTAVSYDVILLMLGPDWLGATGVIPFIAIGLAAQGIYLLTSIGLNLTKRTEFYPVATFAALGVGLGLGLWLMPRYGSTGAAVAFMLAYVTQMVVAFFLSQRVYPIEYEVGRLIRIVTAGVLAALAGSWVMPAVHPLVGLVLRAAVACAVYGAVLAATGFFRVGERAFAREVIGRLRRRPAPIPGDLDGGK